MRVVLILELNFKTMKEKIIEILNIKAFYHENQETFLSHSAEDIADVVDAFIEWLCSNAQFDLLAERQYLICTETHVLEDMTLNEAFNYWWDNVKEKS